MSLDSDYWLRFRSSGGGGGSSVPGSLWRGSAGSAHASAFDGAVKRSPQVMVKVTGRSKTAKGVAAHLDYIGREGDVAVEDQDGERVPHELLEEMAEDWGDTASGGPRASTKAVAITFSMPTGTDAYSVRMAVRDTLKREIGDNNDYVMALHTDTDHPHVHALIRAEGRDGRTFNPRPDDLQRLREGFRRELNARGIEAEATPCAFRMERQRGASMALTKMVARAERGEIETPRRADRVGGQAPQDAGSGIARPANPSERKRWLDALQFWQNEATEFDRHQEGPEAELAQRMADHTRDARENGFKEAEYGAREAKPGGSRQERDRPPERDAPTLSR